MNYTNEVVWFDLTLRIFKVHYAKPVAKQDLMVTRMINVVDSLDPSSKWKHDGPTVEVRSIRSRKPNKWEIEQAKHKGLFNDAASISIDMTIKWKALQLLKESNTQGFWRIEKGRLYHKTWVKIYTYLTVL